MKRLFAACVLLICIVCGYFGGEKNGLASEESAAAREVVESESGAVRENGQETKTETEGTIGEKPETADAAAKAEPAAETEAKTAAGVAAGTKLDPEADAAAGAGTQTSAGMALESEPQKELAAAVMETADWSGCFDGLNGCAVVYDPATERYLAYNPDLCSRETSPYSTFKIISTLAGLKCGVIEGKESVMSYSGLEYPVPGWNENLTLQQAFQSSCIWYFRQVIDAVGRDEMQDELEKLNYGNCDVSEWEGSGLNPLPDLNGFWLDSSLMISPVEQVQALKAIFEGESIYREEHIQVLKEIMRADGGEAGKRIYGKTGSGRDEAWFVGFYESEDNRRYFAVYLHDGEHSGRVSGEAAKKIAEKIGSGMF